jgi:hypothetical protein
MASHGAVAAARLRGLDAVVVGDFAGTRHAFETAGWTMRLLGDSSEVHWVLATAREYRPTAAADGRTSCKRSKGSFGRDRRR